MDQRYRGTGTLMNEAGRLRAAGKRVVIDTPSESGHIEGPAAIVTGFVAWKETGSSVKERSEREHSTLALRHSGDDWQVLDEQVACVIGKGANTVRVTSNQGTQAPW